VVKAFNTMNCRLMVGPSLVPGHHNLFVCGNDSAAKTRTIQCFSEWFGWQRANVIDLGDITASRGMEMLMPFWLRLRH
jgi:predicted dinucleotide-binding enzyme